jgi:hypothetical protein
MLDAIGVLVLDGRLETKHGYFADGERLKTAQEDGADPPFGVADFSGAPYWWVPRDMSTGAPRPYGDEAAIFR